MNLSRIVRIAAGISATSAVAGIVVSLLEQNWLTAGWAFTAALAMTVLAVHRCHTPPPPVHRGRAELTFTGGPLDGAALPLPPLNFPDLQGTALEIDGTQYRITSIDHTCYTAEAEAHL